VDLEAARRFALKVWQVKQGEVVALTIHLGVRLGLYDAMRGAGPMTPDDLAHAADVDVRWTREWLYAQAAADLLEHADGRFRLTDEGAAVLADDEHSPLYAARVFDPGDPSAVADAVVAAFREGRGFTYDEPGHHLTALTEAMNDPWARLLLVPDVLPAFDGLLARLEAGIDVVDVGCGAGGALAAMGPAFPASSFLGLDLSEHAVARALARVAETPNVRVARGTPAELPAGSADLVTVFDVLHDLARPDRALAAIRHAVRDDGLVIVKEIKTAPTFEAQRRNPVLAMMYGISLMACLPSGYDDGEGHALGNQGLTFERLRELATDAGFSTVEVHDLDDPVNLYYELRP
jgi:SAM-dependent methyltransferase